MRFWFVFFISGLLFLAHAHAGAEGIVLDYPAGRYQEDKPPNFFKWSLYDRSVVSLALKVYRVDIDGSYDPIKDLVGRFDFTSDTESMIWPRAPLYRGEYVWTMDGYNNQSPEPIFHEEREFVIEPMSDVDLRTIRWGVQVGFSRGTYTSSDPTFNVGFQTTPTIYGILFRGGSDRRIWDLSMYISDFTLKGSVRQTLSGYGAYSFRVSSASANKTDLFLGPALRTFTFPRARSSDGSDIRTTQITQLSPGLLLSAQKRMDFKITLYSQLMADLPVVATARSEIDFKQLGYGMSAGIIFGQFWPLSFSGELQYRTDKASTFDGNDRVNVTMDGISLIANMVYAL
jgi:hypothetical protein